MIDLLKLCRLYYCAPFSFAYGLTVCYASGDRMAGQWPGVAWSSLALMLVVAAAYVLNDVLDVDVDRINAPARPIAAGRVSRRGGAIWAAVLLAAGLAAGLLCRPPFLAGLAVLAVGLAGYDLLSKRLGPLKQLTVAVLTVAIYPLAVLQAGGATGSRAATLAFFPVWLFLTAFAYEGFKDIRDRAGDDRAAGGVNWIVRYPWLAVGLFRLATVLGGLSLIAPAFAGCGRVYAVLVAPAIVAAVISAFLPSRRVLVAIYVECVLVGLAATADFVAAAS